MSVTSRRCISGRTQQAFLNQRGQRPLCANGRDEDPMWMHIPRNGIAGLRLMGVILIRTPAAQHSPCGSLTPETSLPRAGRGTCEVPRGRSQTYIATVMHRQRLYGPGKAASQEVDHRTLSWRLAELSCLIELNAAALYQLRHPGVCAIHVDRTRASRPAASYLWQTPAVPHPWTTKSTSMQRWHQMLNLRCQLFCMALRTLQTWCLGSVQKNLPTTKSPANSVLFPGPLFNCAGKVPSQGQRVG